MSFMAFTLFMNWTSADESLRLPSASVCRVMEQLCWFSARNKSTLGFYSLSQCHGVKMTRWVRGWKHRPIVEPFSTLVFLLLYILYKSVTCRISHQDTESLNQESFFVLTHEENFLKWGFLRLSLLPSSHLWKRFKEKVAAVCLWIGWLHVISSYVGYEVTSAPVFPPTGAICLHESAEYGVRRRAITWGTVCQHMHTLIHSSEHIYPARCGTRRHN